MANGELLGILLWGSSNRPERTTELFQEPPSLQGYIWIFPYIWQVPQMASFFNNQWMRRIDNLRVFCHMFFNLKEEEQLILLR